MYVSVGAFGTFQQAWILQRAACVVSGAVCVCERPCVDAVCLLCHLAFYVLCWRRKILRGVAKPHTLFCYGRFPVPS
jgi:hypothetical protein